MRDDRFKVNKVTKRELTRFRGWDGCPSWDHRVSTSSWEDDDWRRVLWWMSRSTRLRRSYKTENFFLEFWRWWKYGKDADFLRGVPACWHRSGSRSRQYPKSYRSPLDCWWRGRYRRWVSRDWSLPRRLRECSWINWRIKMTKNMENKFFSKKNEIFKQNTKFLRKNEIC